MLLATIAGTGITYHHPDHLSNRAETDASGNLVRSFGHFPYGESWYETSADQQKFTTYPRDSGVGESGLDYAMFRHYNSGQGRFMSADLLGGSVDMPQSGNRYAYVLNDPINSLDLWGLCTGFIGRDKDGSPIFGERPCHKTEDGDDSDGVSGSGGGGGGGGGGGTGGCAGPCGGGGGGGGGGGTDKKKKKDESQACKDAKQKVQDIKDSKKYRQQLTLVRDMFFGLGGAAAVGCAGGAAGGAEIGAIGGTFIEPGGGTALGGAGGAAVGCFSGGGAAMGEAFSLVFITATADSALEGGLVDKEAAEAQQQADAICGG
jgi:RHS repeat-associated protein